MAETKQSVDLARIREGLAAARGPQFWRSLDELADTDRFREYLEREFPRGASELPTDPVSRRHFLKLMGASMVLAGATGCAFQRPQAQIAPYARAPENQTPGIPLYYATSMPLSGYATGVVVKSNTGKPTKIEGNPLHPASLGATDIYAQAETLALCDPDRSQAVLNEGGISTYDKFRNILADALQVQAAVDGAGIRVLTGTVTSPTMAAQLADLLSDFPQARWYQYEPLNRDNLYAGAELAFGEPVETRYRFDQAQVIVTLDADFLAPGPGSVRYAHDFAQGRTIRATSIEMNRLYSMTPTPGITSLSADHQLPLRSSQIEPVTRFIAAELGIAGTEPPAEVPQPAWIAAMLRDLQNHQGRSIVLAGPQQPPVVHALVHAINAALGNLGTTIEYTDPVPASAGGQLNDLVDLVDEMRNDQVEMLFIIDANPVYNAPGELGFAEAMQRVGFKVHMGLYEDETALLANWHIPMNHPLESWGDLRAYDGTASLIQPLILPLYDTVSPYRLLDAITGTGQNPDYDIIRGFWRQQRADLDDVAFDDFWNTALHDGLIADSAFPARELTPANDFSAPVVQSAEGIELVFRADPTVYDGRYANNGWLQELPKPVSTLTWDNAALVAPATAEALGLSNEQIIEIGSAGRALRAPVWIMPGHAPDCITLHLGYGRSRAGGLGSDQGFSAYLVRSVAQPWIATGASVTPMDLSYPLAVVQDHFSMEGRHLVRAGVFEAFKENPKYINQEVYIEEYGQQAADGPDYQSLLPDPVYTGNAWGMSIDLTTCIGCNACTIACQSENKIPVIGKREVLIGREMHWIRIDRYFAGSDYDNPAVYVQPLTCMHCERAPCEIVCPVNATVHDHEGLNNMIYNRCVGTKYCSNNCPYKVRRFNFFQYADNDTLSLQIKRNPEVTVRNLGVMEKCSYCIQRISHARIEAKKRQVQTDADFKIADGTVITACQQVCPTRAITFGDVNDPESKVAALKAEPHDYVMLGFLQTLPRTSYLARIRNPNPELEPRPEPA